MCACLVWIPGFHSFPKCTIKNIIAFVYLGVQNKFHLENQINHVGNTLSKIMTDSPKIYTLFRTERTKTIPRPAAHPHMGHIQL